MMTGPAVRSHPVSLPECPSRHHHSFLRLVTGGWVHTAALLLMLLICGLVDAGHAGGNKVALAKVPKVANEVFRIKQGPCKARGDCVQDVPLHFSHLVRDWLPSLVWCMREHGVVGEPFRIVVPRSTVYLIRRLVRLWFSREEVIIFTSGPFQKWGAECRAMDRDELDNHQNNVAAVIQDRTRKGFEEDGFECDGAKIVLVERGLSQEGRTHVVMSRKRRGAVTTNGVTRRAILNTIELENAMMSFAASNGITVEKVIFEQLRDPKTILRKMCAAEILVGLHGAGLLNIIFSAVPVKKCVVEIASLDVELPLMWEHKCGDVYVANNVTHVQSFHKAITLGDPLSDGQAQNRFQVNPNQVISDMLSGCESLDGLTDLTRLYGENHPDHPPSQVIRSREQYQEIIAPPAPPPVVDKGFFKNMFRA